MKIIEANLAASAVQPNQYPQKPWPDLALVGRSNVGKSSLINALLGKKNLARVAAKPGKTGIINFYNVNNQFFLVDLPGYGYAQVAKTTKLAWQGMIETYLTTRKQLKYIFLLVDIRHAPTEDDRIMVNWLHQMEKPYLVVATKADKIGRTQINQRLTEIRKTLELPDKSELIAFSARSLLGRNELWQAIRSALSYP